MIERRVTVIDFENSKVWKLRKAANENVGENLQLLLIEEETIIGVYKSLRDYVVFTNKRVISCNVQGMTGKKQDFTSLPYKKISVFSIETSGLFDMDSELEMYFSGVGKVKFEFSGQSDIVQIGRCISSFAL